MSTDMTQTRVFELIAAHGGNHANWPEAERDAAHDLIKSEPDVFAAALVDARLLDEAITNIPEPAISADLAARILNDAPKMGAQSTGRAGLFAPLLSLKGRNYLWPLRAATASLITGVVLGYGAMAATMDDGLDADEIFYMALDTGYAMDFEEIEP